VHKGVPQVWARLYIHPLGSDPCTGLCSPAGLPAGTGGSSQSLGQHETPKCPFPVSSEGKAAVHQPDLEQPVKEGCSEHHF